MALIQSKDMTTLYAADTLVDVADCAELAHEQMSIAHALNNAANTGEYSTEWNKPISKEMMQILESYGYLVETRTDTSITDSMYIIKWKKKG